MFTYYTFYQHPWIAQLNKNAKQKMPGTSSQRSSKLVQWTYPPLLAPCCWPAWALPGASHPQAGAGTPTTTENVIITTNSHCNKVQTHIGSERNLYFTYILILILITSFRHSWVKGNANCDMKHSMILISIRKYLGVVNINNVNLLQLKRSQHEHSLQNFSELKHTEKHGNTNSADQNCWWN